MDQPLVLARIADFLAAADDRGRFACTDRACNVAASSCASITVASVHHLDGAIALGGSNLRELRISCIDGAEAAAADLGRLRDRAPSTSTSICVIDTRSWSEGARLLSRLAFLGELVQIPSVRELRLAHFSYADEVDGLIVHPKVVIDGTLSLDYCRFGRANDIANLLRHDRVETLCLNSCANLPAELLARTSARHVDLTKVTIDDQAVLLPIAANARVKELTIMYTEVRDIAAIAALLRLPHRYDDGLSLSCELFDNAVADPAHGRALADALSSPSLHIGTKLLVDTTGISELDAFLGVVASCASRNVGLRSVTVVVDGVPASGEGLRALVRLPSHIERVSLESWDEQYGSHLRTGEPQNDWAWHALASIDMPSLLSLRITCAAYCAVGGDAGAHRLAGLSVARGAPRLESVDLTFEYADEYPMGDEWVDSFSEGFSSGLAAGVRGSFERKNGRVTLTWTRTRD